MTSEGRDRRKRNGCCLVKCTFLGVYLQVSNLPNQKSVSLVKDHQWTVWHKRDDDAHTRRRDMTMA